MIENIKGVIFDLDGTLVDSMWIWRQIDIDYLGKRGILLPDDLQKVIEGMSFTETAHYFKDRFKLEDSIEEIKGEWLQMTKDYYQNHIPLKSGVQSFLKNLKDKGIKIGIGTSNDRELAEIVLKSNGIIEYFDSIRTSCEVKKGKPHPDVFLKVAEDLGVAPKFCLVFEDTYAGVLAAKRAGMGVFAIADEHSFPFKSEISALADKYIEEYEEIA